jgi:hypothetical protein
MGINQIADAVLSPWSFIGVGVTMMFASYLQRSNAKHPIETKLTFGGGLFLVLFGSIQLAMPIGQMRFAIILSVTAIFLVWQAYHVTRLRASKHADTTDIS